MEQVNLVGQWRKGDSSAYTASLGVNSGMLIYDAAEPAPSAIRNSVGSPEFGFPWSKTELLENSVFQFLALRTSEEIIGDGTGLLNASLICPRVG